MHEYAMGQEDEDLGPTGSGAAAETCQLSQQNSASKIYRNNPCSRVVTSVQRHQNRLCFLIALLQLILQFIVVTIIILCMIIIIFINTTLCLPSSSPSTLSRHLDINFKIRPEAVTASVSVSYKQTNSVA
jgi:hypothetical protein